MPLAVSAAGRARICARADEDACPAPAVSRDSRARRSRWPIEHGSAQCDSNGGSRQAEACEDGAAPAPAARIAPSARARASAAMPASALLGLFGAAMSPPGKGRLRAARPEDTTWSNSGDRQRGLGALVSHTSEIARQDLGEHRLCRVRPREERHGGAKLERVDAAEDLLGRAAIEVE